MNRAPLLDGMTFAKLQDLGGNSFAARMVEVFLDCTPKMLAEARAALGSANLEPIERNAHSIKSSCRNIGAATMRAAAERLEIAVRAGEVESLPNLFHVLEQRFAELQPVLERKRAELAP